MKKLCLKYKGKNLTFPNMKEVIQLYGFNMLLEMKIFHVHTCDNINI